jgi:Electron transfer DM13
MKKLIIGCLLLASVACKNEIVTPIPTETKETKTVETPTKTETPVKDQTLLASGDFMAAAHATAGIVKIYEDNKTKKQSLVLEGFKTDAGPDLRIYLAEDAKATNFVEVTNTVKNGDITHEMPANFDAKKQVFVLIWCKQFSVLFGSAKLK